jgi:hypothetical protein
MHIYYYSYEWDLQLSSALALWLESSVIGELNFGISFHFMASDAKSRMSGRSNLDRKL